MIVIQEMKRSIFKVFIIKVRYYLPYFVKYIQGNLILSNIVGYGENILFQIHHIDNLLLNYFL